MAVRGQREAVLRLRANRVMKDYSLVTALWLGILTSISPCPLASNIAALSYLSAGAGRFNSKGAALSGLFYTFGRMVAYTGLAFLITWQLLSIPEVANFLQRYMSLVLGPLLFLAGMVMLDLFTFSLPGLGGNRFVERLLKRHPGLVGSTVMGVIFALSFCPVSAALFFGSLVPLAISNHSPLILPLAYGAGTAAPVVGAAVAVGLGFDITGRFYEAQRSVGRLAKRLTGAVFVLVGLYYTWTFLVPFLERLSA